MEKSTEPIDRIVRFKELQSLVGGYCYTTIWRLEKENKFPKRVKLGPRAVGWRLSDIQDWIKNRQPVSYCA